MARSLDFNSRLYRFTGRNIARFIALVRAKSTVIIEPHDAMEVIDANHPFIFAMWHGQFMMLPALHTDPKRKVSAILAKHGDAETLGEILTRFNISLVRGAGAAGRAKDRGGAQAMRSALKLLRGGSTFALTADVPPGPARVAGEGIVLLARISGRPIIPFAAATSRYYAFKSWSRMTINLPYGKLAYVIGPPIFVPADADEEQIESYRRRVQDALDAATSRAYELAGADPRRATPPKPAALSGLGKRPGFKLRLYRGATSLMRPLSPLLLKLRERQKKEDPGRRSERFGIASVPRPSGPLAWVHAASVGETTAVLPLMKQLAADCPGLKFLLTTGTLTSAALAEKRLPEGSIHQFVPLDTPEYARSFLDHWRPDLAIFTESELWPNLIVETGLRNIPLALVNARMSGRSYRRWSRTPGLAAEIIGRFDVILAQNPRYARWFKALGGRNVEISGNLKIDAPPPPVVETELDRLKEALAGRPVFVAASTHEGEEEIIAAAHHRLAADVPGLCTIIAPRHPDRATAIAAMLNEQGLSVRRRSSGELPDARTDVYLADTIGELGLLYSLAPVAFIGGSLVDLGGQNPIEAVAHGVVVLTGPHSSNFRDVYRTLVRHKGASEITDAATLAAEAKRLIENAAERERMSQGARTAMLMLGGALDKTAKSLARLLPEPEVMLRAS